MERLQRELLQLPLERMDAEELHAGAYLRRAPRVVEAPVSGSAHLAGVRARGDVERPRQQLAVGVRLVSLDLGKQLVDEVLVSFEYCHTFSVARPFAHIYPAG